MIEAWIVGVCIGYLIGSVPVGLWVGKYLVGVDVRSGGSGKIGATNAFRRLGLRWSVLVFGIDVAKGVIPVLIVRTIFDSPTTEVIAALSSVVGHIYPIYANFRGGRAAATGFGALLVMSPPGAAITIGVAIVVLGLTRIMSLSVLLGMSVGAVLHGLSVAHTSDADSYLGFSVGAWLIVTFAHRDNIARLFAGTERILGQTEPNADAPGEDRAPVGTQTAGD